LSFGGGWLRKWWDFLSTKKNGDTALIATKRPPGFVGYISFFEAVFPMKGLVDCYFSW